MCANLVKIDEKCAIPEKYRIMIGMFIITLIGRHEKNSQLFLINFSRFLSLRIIYFYISNLLKCDLN